MEDSLAGYTLWSNKNVTVFFKFLLNFYLFLNNSVKNQPVVMLSDILMPEKIWHQLSICHCGHRQQRQRRLPVSAGHRAGTSDHPPARSRDLRLHPSRCVHLTAQTWTWWTVVFGVCCRNVGGTVHEWRTMRELQQQHGLYLNRRWLMMQSTSGGVWGWKTAYAQRPNTINIDMTCLLLIKYHEITVRIK